MEHASPPIEASSQDRSVVLLVDDERGPRESLRMILRPGYDVLTARDGQEAMRVLRTNRVDLVTLDLNMPGVHGTELMRTLRREFPEVEIVVVTGNPCIESATEALRYGIGDYLQKPFDVVQVTAAVYRCLSRRRGRRRLTSFLDGLAEVVGYEGDATQVLSQAKGDPRLGRWVGDLLDRTTSPPAQTDPVGRTLAFLEVLADTVESQSAFLRGHARRTAFYAGALADRIGLSPTQREHVRIAAFLHDIGKIGVPSELLTRPGALSQTERITLEAHPEIGARLIEPLGMPTDVVAAIRHHHEWWDGRGYGDGLYGDQIPLSARIVAVADAYDAMSCDRPYRDALAPQMVRHEIQRFSGTQFDPRLAVEFLEILDQEDVLVHEMAEPGLLSSAAAL
jgi:putative nucleotidyltransferase with HDIG domain